jgi:hypothetical protein
MGGAKEAGHSSRLESDTHRSQFAEDDGFREGSTHPTGYEGSAVGIVPRLAFRVSTMKLVMALLTKHLTIFD